MTTPGAHAAPPSGPLAVLGMAALVLLPLVSIFGGIEFRSQLLTVLRKLDAASRQVRVAAARLPFLRPNDGRHCPARPVFGASAGSTPAALEPSPATGTAPEEDGARLSAAPSGTARRNGANLGTQPRRQPWVTSEQPAVPAPPPKHAYDPGDGAEPPVALVRPYMLPVYGEACQLAVAEAQRLAEVYVP